MIDLFSIEHRWGMYNLVIEGNKVFSDSFRGKKLVATLTDDQNGKVFGELILEIRNAILQYRDQVYELQTMVRARDHASSTLIEIVGSTNEHLRKENDLLKKINVNLQNAVNRIGDVISPDVRDILLKALDVDRE